MLEEFSTGLAALPTETVKQIYAAFLLTMLHPEAFKACIVTEWNKQGLSDLF